MLVHTHKLVGKTTHRHQILNQIAVEVAQFTDIPRVSGFPGSRPMGSGSPVLRPALIVEVLPSLAAAKVSGRRGFAGLGAALQRSQIRSRAREVARRHARQRCIGYARDRERS